ncbi:MAG: hypothetical protein ABMA26_25780 [Limisphaerales bacterium]
MKIVFSIFSIISFLLANTLLRSPTAILLNGLLFIATTTGVIATFGIWKGYSWARIPGMISLVPWICLPLILLLPVIFRQSVGNETTPSQLSPIAVLIVLIPPLLWAALAARLLFWLRASKEEAPRP